MHKGLSNLTRRIQQRWLLLAIIASAWNWMGATTAAQAGTLVAAYSFNEGSGTTVADASGNGNNGTISAATWTNGGKFGSALVFNGSSARVTINDSASLHLTTAMTLEAWVRPSTVSSAWRDVIYKGNDNYYLEGTSDISSRPAMGGTFSPSPLSGTAALTVNTWAHLAATYDGTTMRLYVNGAQVASRAQTGSIATSTNPLQIGGDSIYGQFFRGTIDEVRVYNVALTAAQIQTDMNTPIAPDTQPPTAPANLTATAVSGSQINLSWTASTDNVGVTGYLVERQNPGSGSFVQVATPVGTTYNDTGLTNASTYSYRVRATDAAGNLSPYSGVATATTPDTQPPTAPGGLAATAVSGSQINLSWTASTDNVGVTGYLVERQNPGNPSFVQVGTATGTTYNDTGVTNATSYSYRVRATDAAGNLSLYSGVASATTPDTQPPTAPASLTATAVSGTQINLSWPASTDNVGVTGYLVERQNPGGGSYVQVATPAGTTYNDTGLTAGSNYSYRVRAMDLAGNLSLYSPIANATTLAPDTQPPTAPSSLTATAVSGSQINLSWTASTDNVGVTGYLVERQDPGSTSFVQIATPAGTNYNDTGLTAGTNYSYRVRATDAAGNLSSYSPIASATTLAPDTQPPTAPASLTATTVSGSQINLSWTASTDNVGVTGYLVERQNPGSGSFVQIGTPAGTTYNDTGLTNASTYSYRVRATDAAGNLSTYSPVASATTLDTQPPTAPASLTATAVSGSQINLSWTASTDNVGVTGYLVERQSPGSASFVQVGTPTGTTYNDTGLTSGTNYSYRVRATDAAGNLSTYSSVASATTPDTQPPTAPASLTATAVSGSQINLSWAASTDNVGVTGYLVERQNPGTTSFVQVGTPAGTTYNDTGLTPGTNYSYRVRATDAAGNLSTYSPVASATTSATVPGLVAAYSFNEGSGTAVADSSGNGNGGTISGATWTSTGKYGKALVFNGTSALVTVNNAASLQLTTGMTLEAWVNPSAVNNAWRDVIYKGNDNYYLEGTSDTSSRPAMGGTFSPSPLYGTAALTVNTWAHLAATYDRVTMRLYVNGVQVASRAQTGNIATSTNPLQIGGDSLYGQYFQGMIDEVRVYSVALTAAQIQTDMTTPISAVQDTQPPTAPATLTATAVGGTQVQLSWSASTDNVGVAGYLVERQNPGSGSFVQVGTAVATSYIDTGLTTGTNYSYRVRATDPAGNLSLYSPSASATTLPYAVASDNFNRANGALGANWTKPIASENNLVVVNNQVGVDIENSHNYAFWSANTFTDNQYSQATITTIGAWTGVILRSDSVQDRFYIGFVFAPNDYRIYSRWDGAYYSLATGATQTWQVGDILRLEAKGSVDPITLTMYRNGTAVLSWVSTGSGQVRTGGSPGLGIYSPTGLGLTLDNWEGGNLPPDTQPPTAPANLTATAFSGSQINLSWSASTDNVGVTGYLVEREDPGSTSFVQIGTATGTTYNDTGLAANSNYSYRVRATDAAGNLSGYSPVASATTPAPDTQPPTAPATLTATAVSSSQINLSWSASTDNVGVTGYMVERQGGGSGTFTQVGTATGTTFNDVGLAANTAYTYRVRATDAAGNLSPYSPAANATTLTAPTGLVAAYGFNEASGTTVTDLSGHGNNGTISGATWTATGKYGNALVFNGAGSLVTINNSTSLQLTSAMTLEAWVNPSVVSSAWRDVIYKGNDNYFLEGTSDQSGVPGGGGTFGASDIITYGTGALVANTWTHLAVTYDASTLRLYLNGVQVASRAQTGNIVSSTNPLQIGGDSIWGQYFQGSIDEVRIYSVALTAAQIQTDMNTPLGSVPTPPGNLTATVVGGMQVNLSWTASTDAAGVTGYFVERCQGVGCASFAQIGTTTGTSYSDTGLTPSTTYNYRVRAVDSVGATGPYSQVAQAYTGLSVSPRTATLTVTRTQQFTPSLGPVTWAVDGIAGGSAAVGTITAAGLYTPPGGAGTHTVTATTSDQSLVGNSTVYVTVYPGTFTHHNDNLRTGQNLNETVLNPANVTSATFGRLFSYPIDGLAYSSPLYVANVSVPGQGYHNMVFVCTEHDSVYAFDADGLSGSPLWHDSFINPAAGVTTVPAADTGETGDIPNEIGITSTPVIDPASSTLYIVAKTKEVQGNKTSYVQRLHALDITTGAEKFGGPVVIAASFPGTGAGSQAGVVHFDPLLHNQRAALLLTGGIVYLAWGTHGNPSVYHGWVMGYSAATLQQVMAYNATPNARAGGVWQGGGGVAVDASGSLYFATGNGTFDADTGGGDYGDSVVKISPSGLVLDYFTPHDQLTLDTQDIDLSPGGVLLLPDQSGPYPHLLISMGKGGTLYLINRDNMGHFMPNSDAQIVQVFPSFFPGGNFETGNRINPVYFNGNVYFSVDNDNMKMFHLSNGLLSSAPTSQSSDVYLYPGGPLAISANGASDGILWVIQRFGLDASGAGTIAPGVLRAYDPANLANILYDSNQAASRDTMDYAAKFSVPLIANGKVFVGSESQLSAYGLLP